MNDFWGRSAKRNVLPFKTVKRGEGERTGGRHRLHSGAGRTLGEHGRKGLLQTKTRNEGGNIPANHSPLRIFRNGLYDHKLKTRKKKRGGGGCGCLVR